MKFPIGVCEKSKKDVFSLNKNKRENILISGSIGSGVYHQILCLFSSMLDNNHIESSITFNNSDSIDMISYFYNLLSLHNISHKFELINFRECKSDINLNAISSYINDCLDNEKHILIILPTFD